MVEIELRYGQQLRIGTKVVVEVRRDRQHPNSSTRVLVAVGALPDITILRKEVQERDNAEDNASDPRTANNQQPT